MPKDTYTVTLTKKEFEYILESLENVQEDLSHHGASSDFLNRLVDKIDAVLYKEEKHG